MLVKVKATRNGFHENYQRKGTEFIFEAEAKNGKPVLGSWMELVKVIKKKPKPKPKIETEVSEESKEAE